MRGVKVAVRVRPLSQKEKDAGMRKCCSVLPGTNVVVIKREQRDPYLKSQGQGVSEYEFDSAFDDDATQQEVYEKTTKPYLKNLIAGLNVTVFAYGATGAGKTHTMMGNSRRDDATNHAEAGIIPNSLTDLFKQLEDKKHMAAPGERYDVSCSFMEVYNEQVYDLVEPTGKVLQICEDAVTKSIMVRGLATQQVPSPEAVFELLDIGNKNRKTEATMANQVSSRSHAILQLTLKHVRVTDSGREAQTTSMLNLIDLAGSERASATNNRGARLQEGANINKSLLALANCINSLATKNGGGKGNKKTNVKYRDSKLTHLLKSSLEGNCNLIMIANVNPSHVTYEDSHNTLKYSNRAKNIKVDPKAQENAKDSSWVEREHRLRDENARLRNRVLELEAENKALKARSGNSPAATSLDDVEVDLIDGDDEEEEDSDSAPSEDGEVDDEGVICTRSAEASFEVGSAAVEAWGTPSSKLEAEAIKAHEEATGAEPAVSAGQSRGHSARSRRGSIGSIGGDSSDGSSGPRPWARRARRASIASLQRAPSAPSALNTQTNADGSTTNVPSAAMGSLPDIPEAGAPPKEEDYKVQIDKLAAIAKDQQEKLDFLMRKDVATDDTKVGGASANVSPGKRKNRDFYEEAVGDHHTPLPMLISSVQEAFVDISAMCDDEAEGEVTLMDESVEGAISTDLGDIMGDLLNEDDGPMEPMRVPTPPSQPLARMNKKRRGSFIPQPKRAGGLLEPSEPTREEPVQRALHPGRRHTRLSVSSAKDMANQENIQSDNNSNNNNITKAVKGGLGKGQSDRDVGSNLQNIMSKGIRAINERILGKEITTGNNGNGNAVASKTDVTRQTGLSVRGHVSVVSDANPGADMWQDL